MKRFRRTLSAFMAWVMLATVGLSIGTPGRVYAADAVNLAVNPGFENSADALTGWTQSGTGTLLVGNGSGNIHGGARSANYYSADAYQFTLTQTLNNLPDGEYVLKAWASGGGGENTASLFVNGYGGNELQAAISNTGWNAWTQYTVSGIQVTGGQATIGFNIDAPAGTWGYFDDVEFYKVPSWDAGELTATDLTATELTLDWTGVDAPGQITGYRILKDNVLLASTGTATTAYSVTGLTPETEYTFKVEAENGTNLISSDGPSVTVTTAALPTGSAPSWSAGKMLTSSQLTSRRTVLAWSGAQDDIGVTKYRIYEGNVLKATVTGVTSYLLTGLKPEEAYTYKVEAGNAASLWSSDGPSVTFSTPAVPAEPFIKGADISTLQAIEDAGGKYYENGVQRDLLDILQDHGVNYIRLRIWNNPLEADGYNDKAHVVALAKRVKEHGLKLLLDFHYSDFWTDPGKQVKPEAWKNLDFNSLEQAVYDYTAEVMNELKAEDAYPDMVQIGNEINPGMLLPDGSTSNYDKLTALLNKGIQAVRDTTPAGHETKIMLHLAEGGNNGTFRSFFDAMKARNVDYDVIGMSYYAYWHGPFNNLKNNLNDMAARYGKEVVVAETSYGYTLANGDGFPDSFNQELADEAGFPASVEGQASLVTTVMNTVAHVPDGKGVGVFYWEPAWIPVPKDADGEYQAGWKSGEGSAWNNQAMFDFNGNALPSLDVFRFEPGDLPDKTALTAKNPEGITVTVNEPMEEVEQTLPQTADVLYSEGSVEQVPVVWQAIDGDDLSRIGSFEISGTVEGVGKTVKTTVTVTSYRNIASNPGFENSSPSAGWSISGTQGVASFKTNTGDAYAGSNAVNYWSSSAYQFTLSQTVTGLEDGIYVLKAKVSGGGGENGIHLFAENYGGDKLTGVNVVNTGWQAWNDATLGGIQVTNGQATIGLNVDAPATSGGIWGWIDSFEFYRQVSVPVWNSSKSMTASNTGTRSVTLTWAGVDGTDPVEGYKIYKDGKLLTTVTGNTHTISGLSPNTSYSFKVEASFDGAIWTSTGPSLSLTTSADPSVPVVTVPVVTPAQPTQIVTITSQQLAGGAAVLSIPAAASEIKLPINAAELLAGAPLRLKSESLEMDIPAALLKQLAERVGTGGQEAAISVTIKPVAGDAAEKWITQLENSRNLDIRILGSVYDFGLSATAGNGSAFTSSQFSEPITLRIPKPVGSGAAGTGIFYLADDGSAKYIGGKIEGDFITAKISHFSKYGLMEVKKSFTDVPAAHWASEAIGQLASRLLVSGTDRDSFEPGRAVTRAEYVSLLVNALGLPSADGQMKFTDVPANAWYSGALSAAQAHGLVSGRGDNRFEPGSPVTREEMAKLTVQALHILKPEAAASNGNTVVFTDVSLMSSWAKPYVEAASGLGLMSGRVQGSFAPKAVVTRAEAAQVIWRMLQ
ncbi:glycosyl hydrolase 53 family protein [Paenibacillus sp. sgz500958]|uniref:glycosyl hydrolase 53 family protein n=1 Tax=Paenibacillus sp. sgz500958 TaxID=3242475 RepID=UPI0036D216D5